MSFENPQVSYPEKFPTRVQWNNLLAEPSTVDKASFTPKERVMYDYVTWMVDGLAPGLSDHDLSEITHVQDLQVKYNRTSPEDFFQPSELLFSFSRRNEEDTEGDTLEFIADLISHTSDKSIAVIIETQKMPSLTDEPADIQEIFGDFKVMLLVDTAVVYEIDSTDESQVDQEVLELFKDSLGYLKKNLDSECEIEPED